MPILVTMAGARASAIKLLGLSLLIGIPATAARAQPPQQQQQPTQQTPAPIEEDTARGIKLYQQGDAKKAIEVLQKVVKNRPADADAWYYLGLSFKGIGAEGSARLAFEHVVDLRPNFADALAKLAYTLILANEPARALQMAERAMMAGDRSAEAHYTIAEASLRQDAPEKALEEAEKALKIKPDLLLALLTKGMAHYGLKQYEKAADSFFTLLLMSPNNVDAEAWQIQLEHLRRSAARVKENQPSTQEAPVLRPSQVTVKARLLSKPEPQYTEEARLAGVSGTVVLRAVFSSDGTVKNLFINRWLPFGLTTRAVQAAQRMRFSPATIDGRPVSQYIQIEYNFNLY
ncbi:MAG TPA: TonB family protein [Pyrinomonadaceae bacterium]|jgi:TonB family protein